MRFRRQKGQALLIVLLSMSVVLIVVLSILSFSITDVAVTTREEEALRAFSAAEAGIERALILESAVTGDFGGAAYDTAITDLAEGLSEFNYPLEIVSGDTATVWFVAHDDAGSLVCDAGHPCFTGQFLKVCWGKDGTAADSGTTPAIEVSVYYAQTPGDYSTVNISRETIDPNSSRRASNSFTAPDAGSCAIEGTAYAFQKTIDFDSLGIPSSVYGQQDGLQIARVRFLYNDVAQILGVSANFPGNSLFPSQGARVESTGTAGEATRKVEVLKLHSDLPGIFESSLFVPSAITK